jgi:hypothetical protein
MKVEAPQHLPALRRGEGGRIPQYLRRPECERMLSKDTRTVMPQQSLALANGELTDDAIEATDKANSATGKG